MRYTYEHVYVISEEVWTMKVEKIVELILDAARESRVLSGGFYKDEPIIRTGKDAFRKRTAPQRAHREPRTLLEPAAGLADIVPEAASPVPERIAQMRALARRSQRWAFSYADPKLFYEQARFMESYRDDAPYRGGFERYYPTYEDMSTAQLRGYFTWRTRWRAGDEVEAPLSFLFVHAYELLCGVGVAHAAEGYTALGRLRAAYGQRAGNGALDVYLATWMRDYAVYHGLDAELLGAGSPDAGPGHAIAVIDAAEHALLGSSHPARWDDALPGLPEPGAFTRALAAASRYRLERSKLFSERFDEMAECCCAVFARMVDHCRRRRKRGFSEGLFGGEETLPYAMFRSAVFFDPAPHPDAAVELPDGTVFSCVHGRWARSRPHRKDEPSAELGNILHEIDRVLRAQLGGFPELKARDVPTYVRTIVSEEVGACVARRAAAEAARVRIDRTALGSIRSAAARTCEALLVEEERAAAPEPALASALEVVPPAAPEPVQPAEQTSAPAVAGLSAEDATLLASLLDGTFDQADLLAHGVMVALAADRINEALFELVGDTVIEFEGDVPRIVPDYADDVRGALA